jgi:hypothetical protein
MHNKTLVLGIGWLCIGPDIKLNWKSGYVCTHIWSLSRCISEIFYITGEHCYNPRLALVVTCFLIYVPIYETYFIQNQLPRWNQILTQLRFMHNWVISGIQGMGHWWGLVHCGQESGSFVKLFQSFRHQKAQSNSNRSYLPFIHI